MIQKTFSAVNENFSWTDDNWYEFDEKAAASQALRTRNSEAKRLKAAGYTVRKFSLGSSQLTRGGIGSGHPEITIYAKVYGFNAEEPW